jgi:hypothetical protein
MSNAKKKKKVEPDDPEQFARFIEASEKIEFVENPKEAFEEAFKKIAESDHIPISKKSVKSS